MNKLYLFIWFIFLLTFDGIYGNSLVSANLPNTVYFVLFAIIIIFWFYLIYVMIFSKIKLSYLGKITFLSITLFMAFTGFLFIIFSDYPGAT